MSIFWGTWALAGVQIWCFPSTARLGLTTAALTCCCDNNCIVYTPLHYDENRAELMHVFPIKYLLSEPADVCLCSTSSVWFHSLNSMKPNPHKHTHTHTYIYNVESYFVNKGPNNSSQSNLLMILPLVAIQPPVDDGRQMVFNMRVHKHRDCWWLVNKCEFCKHWQNLIDR